MSNLKDKIKPPLAMLALLLTLAGCGNGFLENLLGGGDDEREGSLTLTIGRGASRAKDGEAMKRLTVLLVGQSSFIVGREAMPNADTWTVFFESLPRGPYTLYVVANAPDDLTIPILDPDPQLPDGLYDHVLKTLRGTDTLSYGESVGMPLSLRKEVVVAPGQNTVFAELERAVARFSIVVYNHVPDTDKKLCIGRVELSSFNADRGYLFSHDNALPANTRYRAFPGLPGIATIHAYEDATVVDYYLYENAAPDPYKMTISGAIFKKTDEPVTYYPSYTGTTSGSWYDVSGWTKVIPIKDFSITVPITYVNAFGATSPLERINRNEHVRVAVNVYYNDKLGIFTFDVVPWDVKNANTSFD